jgi:conjugative transfer signal peptidase TraF
MKAGLLVRLKNMNRRRAKSLGILALGTLGSVLMVPAIAGVRLNDSPSLPVGLYVVTSDRSADLVEFCPTEPYASLAAGRGYRGEGSCPDGGAPLMKPIAAQPGDTVEISSRGFVVNGKALPNSAPLDVDTDGRSLQHWPFGKYRVETATVWVISSYNRRSFDSRYFGPVSTISIRERVRPLLTLR